MRYQFNCVYYVVAGTIKIRCICVSDGSVKENLINNFEVVIEKPITNLSTYTKKVAFKKVVKHAHSPYRHPSRDLYVIGVTGTNGKTTVTYLIGEVLKSAGYNPFVLGTMNSGNKDLSTPESIDILKFMRAHLDQGGTHFVMEVTSEGIDQERIHGIEFDMKLLTNITQDHLDYHKTFTNYKNTKLNFMRAGDARKVYPDQFKNEPINFSTQLLGDFNLLNIKAAASVLRYIGIDEHIIEKTLSSCLAPRGRLENVDRGQPYLVLIDYAHTPDGLLNILKTVKEIALNRRGRLYVLFGCGGDRDQGKRAKMGKIASDIADYLVITEDNPRSEDGREIMNQILNGVDPEFHSFVLIQDRARAIKYIINQANHNDVIVLAGKGHETYQVLKTGVIHFDDREEAIAAITEELHASELCITNNENQLIS